MSLIDQALAKANEREGLADVDFHSDGYDWSNAHPAVNVKYRGLYGSFDYLWETADVS